MAYVQSVITIGTINVVMVLGLTILTGYTGLFSLGNMGFMMIGAYVAVITYRFLSVPFLVALFLAGLGSMLVGMLIGMPTVRGKLKGDHFAIAMMGFAMSVRIIISNMNNPIVNGALGITGIPRLTTMWIALGVLAIFLYLLFGFVRSAYGRNCRAVREQEIAAEIMGVNVFKVKVTALMICAFCTGVGGGMFAFFMTIIAPAMFTQVQSSNQLIMVVFGGINSLTGPILAAFLLSILPEFLRVIGEWRLVLYGTLVVIIMRVKPEGLLGYKEITNIPRDIKNLLHKVSRSLRRYSWNRR